MDSHEAMMAIQADIEAKQPLIGDLESVDVLKTEYKDSPKFLSKIEELAKQFKHIRRVRGDGNCFYRAYLLSTLERFARKREATEKEARALRDRLHSSLDLLLEQGYSKIAVEDFWETVIEEIDWLIKEKPTAEQVVEKFGDKGVSDYIVMYLRFLTSAQIKANKDLYAPYLPPGLTVDQFCGAEVDPMGKECDYPQCVAATNSISVPLRIVYLDQSDGSLNHHEFAAEDPACIETFLLYRPGHYDVLYK